MNNAKKRKACDDGLGPVGKRIKPDTPLYVKCPQCGGTGPTFTEGVGYNMCFCKHGYVETGYTEELYQGLIKKNDKLLLAFDKTLRELTPSIRTAVLLSHGYTEADVEAARSRV